MNFYLCPTTQQTINNQQVTAPEYFSTDLSGQNFSAIPFGVEPLALIVLSEPNSALAAETDVYAFPADVTTLLQASDVVTLGAFLSNLNIPSSWLTAGATFQSVIRQLAQIALAISYAEGTAGTNGSSIFLQVALPGQSGTPSAALQALPAGVFNFAGANPTDSVADTIIAVSQQFTGEIFVGQGAI
jgi:hypothetical protein